MKICKKCVLPESFPGIRFDINGVCNYCNSDLETDKTEVRQLNFENEAELIECIQKHKSEHRKYDVLVPLSGGVDSCNALITIVEKYKLRALGFHNDHGYEDETAGRNAEAICKALGVDLVIMKQDYLFMKKLFKYINESEVTGLNSCYVCGNILYINAVETAVRFDIPLVINGYSKGQAAQIADKENGNLLFEKILDVVIKTGDKEFTKTFMDKYEVLNKRIAYEFRKDLEKELNPEKVLFVPFYVFDFYKIDKETLKEKIKQRCDWKPLKIGYPARTTNCEMIWLNTHMDLQKMGYSNYHIEYAELVRRG
ncbi:MAG: hypothetical protein GY757_03820, partial [bacterium]|nr:hypothetical protein [bacterium]